jgi:hypothetical protein
VTRVARSKGMIVDNMVDNRLSRSVGEMNEWISGSNCVIYIV